TKTWSPAQSMKYARYDHTATLLESGPDMGKVLVTGGFDSNDSALPSTELYDPTCDKWTQVGDLIAPRGRQTATFFSYGDVTGVLVTGGNTNFILNPLRSAEYYDTAAKKWVSAPDMNANLVFQSATLLPSGKVLITGGRTGGG